MLQPYAGVNYIYLLFRDYEFGYWISVDIAVSLSSRTFGSYNKYIVSENKRVSNFTIYNLFAFLLFSKYLPSGENV
jgi:hypothetical protein